MNRPARVPELDGLRTLAFLAMVATHGARLIEPSTRGPWCAVALLLDPLIQALFMGLVGASLPWSWSAAQGRGLDRPRWLRARARRAGQVYLVGVLLFFFDKGPQLPYLLLAPGILADIALAILLLSPLAAGRFAVPGSLGLAGALYLAQAAMARWELFVPLPPINAGNAAWLPNLPMAALGLAAGRLLHDGQHRRLMLAVSPLLLAGLCLAIRYGPAALLGYEQGRVTSTVVYQGRGHGAGIALAMLRGEALAGRGVEYFNSTLLAQPFVLSLAVLLFLALRGSRRLWRRAEGWLFLPGRHSLMAYALHLALLGLPVAALGRARPFQAPGQGEVWLLGVVLIVWIVAAATERWRGQGAKLSP